MDDRERVEERLKAYIHPNLAETLEQQAAFEDAVDAQVEFEATQAKALGDVPGNVQSFSVGNYSVTKAEAEGASYTRATICPAAWAILFNAGLLWRSLPIARRL